MIGRLRGELIEVGAGHALVECGGVGYDVQIPESVAVQLPSLGSEVILLTRQTFREDAVTLYGFLEPFQRRLFDLMLGVTGCGPKASMALLGLGEDTVAAAILAQDAMALRRASGVGTKLAERILLELKDKIQEEAMLRKIGPLSGRPAKKPAVKEDELVEALLALGYRKNEAESAAERARDRAPDVEGQLRAALALLQK